MGETVFRTVPLTSAPVSGAGLAMVGSVSRSRSSDQAIDAHRILVVGHSGFIGRHVVHALAGVSPGSEVIGASTPEYDLTRPASDEALAALIDDDTSVVFLAGVKRQLGDTLEAFEANIAMATNFCRCLRRRPVRRVIHISSAAVYGEEHHDLAITEQTAVRPTSLYGAAKFASECLIARTLQDLGTGSLTILRPPLVYGPGDASASYGPSGFAKAALSRTPIGLWGDGTERREFLFVRDVAELIAALVTVDHHGVLNPASGESHSYVEVLRLIADALGGDLPTTSRPRTKPQVDHRFQNAELRRLFPGFRFTSLSEGVRATLLAQEATR